MVIYAALVFSIIAFMFNWKWTSDSSRNLEEIRRIAERIEKDVENRTHEIERRVEEGTKNIERMLDTKTENIMRIIEVQL